MIVTVLGTATPYPRPGNPCSGYLLQAGGTGDAGAARGAGGAGEAGATRPTNVWVDAGTGTLAELQRHIALDELDAIVVSHRHADHSADLLVAYYALRFSELRPAHPIPLIAPDGLVDRLVAFLGPNAVHELPRVFTPVTMSGWGEHHLGDLTLEWGPVQHGVPAFGIAAVHAGRRLTYSGDSAPCTSLEELGEGAHLMVVEAGYDVAPSGPPVHHTPDDAGRTAAAAGAERLLLTHLVETVGDDEAVSRASAVFTGEVLLARVGDRIEV
ncbi:MBL fold metallo-hydrolase [Herbiconiux sp. KACC 21604]|uniref:MBL fold metallo-hydrolase n=1 Tax=unclassified Herbiconiux TaxID=2618217 RepID=UPI001490E498|nr:MBL fold metallo-hydrolase [Herbiconiux sp. SALV-R1]QJU55504.1 MBL fold metallo-hydrolase [Herbiconiux sp. SALV-R1]WPO86689.1 MBL fold metallo-hydrolase [Herbiconiux sp. KACC 21604]